ncbi:MAG: ABC transporter permease, partial [Pseudomonadota bacterium]
AWLPGDPAAILLGLNAEPEQIAALRERMGLDRPLPVQYLDWVGGLLTGDLGRSHTYDVPVAELLSGRIALSLPLALIALTLSALIALPAGLFAAARAGRGGDRGVMLGVQIGLAVPNFWLGLLMVFAFSLTFRWLPAGGFPGWEAGLGDALRALVLPALALALPQAAILARVTRASLIDELAQDYVRTARAKGRGRLGIVLVHALPNALVPVLTILGLQFAFLLAGTIIIENVFALPGLGRLIYQAVSQRDLVTVRSCVMLLAGAVILINLAVDLALVLLDPRERRA